MKRSVAWLVNTLTRPGVLCALLSPWLAATLYAQDAIEAKRSSGDTATEMGDEFDLPVNERMAADIDRMVALLGSPDYAQRQGATDGLVEIGAPAIRKLRAAYRATDDLEVRLRLERIVHRAYLDHHVYSRHAFLGISLQPYAPVRDRDEGLELPDGVSGVRITNVISDTAAERGGLLKNDVIIAADGTPLTGRGARTVNSFSQSIASHPPGAHMVLTVVRPNGTHEIDVTLGRCPRERVQQTRIREKYITASQRFTEWWSRFFVGSDDHVAGPD